MSKSNNLIREISRRGYSVSVDGCVITSFSNEVLKTRVSSSHGYLVFGVRDTGDSPMSSRPILVHRLQAYQKFGKKIFKRGIQVRHLDGNPLNNSWENIAIGTQSDNRLDIPSKKRSEYASHPAYNHSEIISDWKGGMSYSQIMDKYDIPSKGTVSFIINKSMESNKV